MRQPLAKAAVCRAHTSHLISQRLVRTRSGSQHSVRKKIASALALAC